MSWLRRILPVALLAAAVSPGCGGGASSACLDDGDCPAGRYCLPASGECSFDCTFDEDCRPGFSCTVRGRCLRDCQPSDELCDGQDNDCDGLTDEDLTGDACSADNEIGSCPGLDRCVDGAWVCDAPSPAVETCNGQDDDCDGQTDEDLPDRSCALENEHGRCDGQERCQDGAWVCDAALPSAEDCDGVDNNCDGSTDEGLAEQPCPLVLGVCQGAMRQCQGADGWTVCDYGADHEPVETRCDGLDNDCDGDVDDGVAPLALCEVGALASDGLDNNCNGAVDEPGGCMVAHPSRNVFIDAYEAVMVERSDCTGQRFGTGYLDDFPADFPDQPTAESRRLYACSLPGELPSRNVTWYQAAFACQQQGKRLCTKQEWSEGCQGSALTRFPYGWTYHPTVCNTFSAEVGDVVATGSFPGCANPEGMYDMSGNLWEWVQSVCSWDSNWRGVQGGAYYCWFVDPLSGAWSPCDLDNPDHQETIQDRHSCQRPLETSFCDSPLTADAGHGFRCCWDPP